MKTIITLLLLISLSGCNSYQGNYTNGQNPFKAFADGYNQSRDRREARSLMRAQTQYYNNQNLNHYRNY